MSIHRDHPFATPEPDRDAARRLRGRLGGAVAVLTSGSAESRATGAGSAAAGGAAGLTVSSLMVALGEPARVLLLLDPEAEVADVVTRTGRAVVQLLGADQRPLAEAFAGVSPAPGGPFRLASWQDSPWGPRLEGASAWAGLRLDSAREVGWSSLLELVVEEVGLGEPVEPLVHRRGRYLPPGAPGRARAGSRGADEEA